MRRRYIEGACGGDPTLQARLEALLLIDRADRGFLEQPAEGVTLPAPVAITEGPGLRIGPYKLLRKSARAAWAPSGSPSRPNRSNAASRSRSSRPAWTPPTSSRRFEAERQALALMDHTNIAKVLDAGTTASGRPYFVMELVKGVPITQYCDELHLPLRERLELFVPVCQAIQHAHQKGIIHRDIKPSNVLVAMQDGKPVPKVIDFGVAKALEQRPDRKSLYTEIGAWSARSST